MTLPETYGDRNPWAKAKCLGLLVVASNDWHIQVDIDRKEAKEAFDDGLTRVVAKYPCDFGPNPELLFTTSHGGNWHVYVKTIRPVGAVERCVIALELGSDQVREGLALVRLSQGVWPVCLFETPAEFEKVVKFLDRRSEL